MSRFFLFRAYHQANSAYPVVTQVCTTATLMATGDVIAQKVIEKKESLDYARTARFFCIGIIYVGPVLRTWYHKLDRILPQNLTYRGLKMMAVDQGLFTPIFVPGFLAVTGAVHQQSLAEIIETVKRDTVPLLMTNWMVWPATQFINFNYVPLAYRILFASGVALFWNIYLSWMANEGVEKTKAGHGHGRH